MTTKKTKRVKMSENFLPIAEQTIIGAAELFDEVMWVNLKRGVPGLREIAADLSVGQRKARPVVEIVLDRGGEFRLRFFAQYDDGRQSEVGDIEPIFIEPTQH